MKKALCKNIDMSRITFLIWTTIWVGFSIYSKFILFFLGFAWLVVLIMAYLEDKKKLDRILK